MGRLYNKMIEEAQKCQKFKSLNGRDILSFPLHVPMGIDVLDFLDDTFVKYNLLLEHVKSPLDNLSVNIEGVIKLEHELLTALKAIRNGKYVRAYEIFEKQVQQISECLPMCKMKMKDGEYYRMRKERDLKRASQMYPLPPELRYLSGSMRFSISGFPCLYIGHSRSVCKLEISETGSMINIKLKEDSEFNLLDLTFSEDMSTEGIEELKFIQAWPLIASCYIVQFYCLRGERVCPPERMNFNENYVIPQLLTTFVRDKMPEINGIRYYTVKDVNLNPFGRGEDDKRNVVIYVDSSSVESYDDFINKFEWGRPYNV